MAKWQQEVTLLIFWDDDNGEDTAPPAKWNWTELTGEQTSVTASGPVRLRLRDAIIRALQMEEDGRALTVAELHRARLGVQGYESNRSGVGATLASTLGLIKEGVIEEIPGPPRSFRLRATE